MSYLTSLPEEKRNNDTAIVAADADRYAALYAAATSEGGLILIDTLRQDIAASIKLIRSKYKDLPQMELYAIIADLDAKSNVLESLINAKDNLDGAVEQLRELTA